MKIGDFDIGVDRHTFVIAEAGVNHNGSLENALRMIDEAKESGADAIKFQIFKSDRLVTEYADMAEYQEKNLGKRGTQLEMLKRLELSYDDFITLKSYCEKKNIIFLSTPFEVESASFLDSINVPLFKISSGDLNNIPFLKTIAGYGRPIILSTGMGTLEEVEEAVNTLNNSGNDSIALLHCTSSYPAPMDQVNLNVIQTLKSRFNVPVGYSDHTPGCLVPIAACSMGASIIEKHFTLDNDMEGPDHKASINPKDFKHMVSCIRTVEKIIGDGEKKVQSCEENTRVAARKSIVAAREIKCGKDISLDDIAYKRPGTGIEPKKYTYFLGKRASVDIKKDQQITWDMVEK